MVTLEDKFLTPGEIARLLKVHLRTVERIMKRREIQYVKIGRQYRITEKALNQYLKNHTEYPED